MTKEEIEKQFQYFLQQLGARGSIWAAAQELPECTVVIRIYQGKDILETIGYGKNDKKDDGEKVIANTVFYHDGNKD